MDSNDFKNALKERLIQLAVFLVVCLLAAALIDLLLRGCGCHKGTATVLQHTESATVETRTVEEVTVNKEPQEVARTTVGRKPRSTGSATAERQVAAENAEGDTVVTVCPQLVVEQVEYADTAAGWRAWVSGIDPQLDSIEVRHRTTYVTRVERKPSKRWHIGVTAGYGYNGQEFKPYIGIGVAYSIFSF